MISIITTLVIPYIIFVGAFLFWQSGLGWAACDCFDNYRGVIFTITQAIFLTGLISVAGFMRKKNKRWNFLYTMVAMIVSLVVFYAVMAIGEYFYVPKGFGF